MEKIIIEHEKIIHILFKHLMVLKNENAFLKNNAAIYSIKNVIPEINLDLNKDLNDYPENKVGTKIAFSGYPENKVDTNSKSDEHPEIKVGINNEIDEHPENKVGTINKNDEYPENKVGANKGIDEYPENKVGIKSKFGSFPVFKTDENTDFLVYSIFEKELLNALEQYIKNGDGQKTLYDFLADFMKAVDERNEEVEKMNAIPIIIRLEDTHYLPEFIQIKLEMLPKLIAALEGHLPRTARRDMYQKVAFELVYLYNEKKSTAADMREETGLSIAGFKKHLPNLIRYGLIKRQAPAGYVLTDTSIHILLELYGIPKTL